MSEVTLAEVLEEVFDLGGYTLPMDVNSRESDESGDTPLHKTVRWENLEYSKILIRNGADINAQGDLGLTPLHVAVYSGNIEIVKFLLDHGARVDIAGELDLTALDICEDDEEMTTLLLQYSSTQ